MNDESCCDERRERREEVLKFLRPAAFRASEHSITLAYGADAATWPRWVGLGRGVYDVCKREGGGGIRRGIRCV